MSETKAQHPERRAGQMWETSFGSSSYKATLERPGTDPSNPGWHTSKGFWSEARWRGDGWIATLLDVDVPAAAPLAAATPSKALPNWTMMALDPGSQRMADQLQKYINEIYQYAQPSYFIPANTWLPPLAAQPAETKLTCGGCEAFEEIGEHSPVCPVELKKAKPAPQPAPAKGPASLCEVKYGSRPCSGAETLRWMNGVTSKPLWCCETCLLDREAVLGTMAKATGKPYTGPERLVRPKLAHSSQWADEAEDVS